MEILIKLHIFKHNLNCNMFNIGKNWNCKQNTSNIKITDSLSCLPLINKTADSNNLLWHKIRKSVDRFSFREGPKLGQWLMGRRGGATNGAAQANTEEICAFPAPRPRKLDKRGIVSELCLGSMVISRSEKCEELGLCPERTPPSMHGFSMVPLTQH